MKFATLALLGVVTAKDLSSIRDKINALRITVSPGGQQRIEAAGNRLQATGEAIKDSRPVRNLGASLERWAQTPEVAAIKRYDDRFIRSPEGQRLIREWTDVAEALQENVDETPNGFHINNGGLQDVADELEDVGQQYQQLDGTHWARGYERRWGAALNNRQAASVGRRFESFKHSAEGQAFGAAADNFGHTVENNVQVTDIPPEWQELDNMLRIDVHNPKAIEASANRVGHTWHSIENSRPVRNLQSSIQRWIESPEVQRYHQLEQEFLSTPRGQRMVREWEDVFHALDEVVNETPTGISIDNTHMNDLEDEVHDVGQQYEELAQTPWQARFERRGRAAMTNRQAQSLERRANSFEHSAEGQALGQSLEHFGRTLERNVEVSDIPPSWQQDMFLF